MTDKNLTDNKITINALKELLEVMLCEGDLQRVSTISHTIDLINRLQAENEELKSAINGFRGYEDKIKAEAYKEFAEKIEERIAVKILKDKSNEYAEGFVDALDGVNGEIDNLLKEIIGE